MGPQMSLCVRWVLSIGGIYWQQNTDVLRDDLLVWHDLYVTCVHNVPHVDYHVTWTQVPVLSSWHLTAWGMLHLTPRMTVSHLNTLFKTTTFFPGRTYSVNENACYQHTSHYLLCTRCPKKNTHSRMQRQKVVPGIMQSIQMRCDVRIFHSNASTAPEYVVVM